MCLVRPFVIVTSITLAACFGAPSGDGSADSGLEEFECEPDGDEDNDCIPSSLEGCGANPVPDTDGDGLPDYYDNDADGDGISDTTEVDGNCTNPPDNDGDGAPDFMDSDSDNDGVSDDLEDRNGDGQVGDCTQTCASTAECPANHHCSLPTGGGAGICYSFECANGETDPFNPDSDGDGTPDRDEGTFVCNPDGLKTIKYTDSSDTQYTAANWRVALEEDAVEIGINIDSPGANESARGFDLPDSNIQVAGYVATRTALNDSAVGASSELVGDLQNSGIVTSLITRVSGSNTTSLDGYPTVLNTILEVSTATPSNPVAMRRHIVATALGRSTSEIEIGNPGWTGQSDTEFVVVFQTIYRPEDNQTVYVGAVSLRSHYDNRNRPTGIHASDLSNGTGLSVSGNGEAFECDTFLGFNTALADIIWVVDESSSVDGERANIAANATVFFNKANDAGLDFRIGVTDMNDASDGIFAVRQTGGTGDRWILPTELAVFQGAIDDPSGPSPGHFSEEHGLLQGKAAIDRHLPRSSSNPQRIRQDAKVVLIYVTDEMDQGLKGAGSNTPPKTHAPNSAQQAFINAHVAPFIANLDDNDGIAHLIADPLPYGFNCASNNEKAHGYYEVINAVGGQLGSICQSDLGGTLDAIIDSIIGEASPLVLSTFPISASIKVARDSQVIERSQRTGWDYRGASNSLIFLGMPFDPEQPSEVVASYRRWAEQIPVD